MEECESIIEHKKMIPFGCVEVTKAGNLSCRHVILAVGPNMNDPS